MTGCMESLASNLRVRDKSDVLLEGNTTVLVLAKKGRDFEMKSSKSYSLGQAAKSTPSQTTRPATMQVYHEGVRTGINAPLNPGSEALLLKGRSTNYGGAYLRVLRRYEAAVRGFPALTVIINNYHYRPKPDETKPVSRSMLLTQKRYNSLKVRKLSSCRGTAGARTTGGG